MSMTVAHDYTHDQLHLRFRDDRIIVDREWVTANSVAALSASGEILEITIYNYYTAKDWQFDEHFVERYHLEEHLDDLRLVYQAFFAPPQLAVKHVALEGPDGNELIIPAGS